MHNEGSGEQCSSAIGEWMLFMIERVIGPASGQRVPHSLSPIEHQAGRTQHMPMNSLAPGTTLLPDGSAKRKVIL